jgi:hypothetical protein
VRREGIDLKMSREWVGKGEVIFRVQKRAGGLMGVRLMKCGVRSICS